LDNPPGNRARSLKYIIGYLLVISIAFLIATYATGAKKKERETAPITTGKPYFSLSTNRTFGTADNPRVWINYHDINSLDFRVYKVRDAVKFFQNLEDPHRLGEEERRSIERARKQSPSILEQVRKVKSTITTVVKRYFRDQLRRESRTTFRQNFTEPKRVPLNIADYARVPLLNPDQMVTSWREMLPPMDESYDTRMVTLGKREPGVYLVEAVNGDLRAYTIAIITNMVLISKMGGNGEMLVYSVDRRAGSPRQNASVRVIRGKSLLFSGKTDRQGVLRAPIKTQSSGKGTLLALASSGDDFAVSEFDPVYFDTCTECGDEQFEPATEQVVGYVYTDRPIYRPEQKVFFKGILRSLGENGYERPEKSVVGVTVDDPAGTKIFDKELQLSERGTFSGELELGSGAALGNYSITARVGNSSSNGYFEVQEYKKPEFKVQVKGPQKFVRVNEDVQFQVEAKYFFGEPVTSADVQYYIYRSRYYHWFWDDDSYSDLYSSEDDEEIDSYGYGNDMVKNGTAQLNDKGQVTIDFKVPEPDADDPQDYTYRLEAQVTDSSRRTIDGRASFVGTRGSITAMADPERYIYFPGDTAKIRVRTATYEGSPVPANVMLRFVEQRWESTKKDGSDYKLIEKDLGSGEVRTDQKGEGLYNFNVQVAGSIAIKAFVKEDDRLVPSIGGSLWVASQKQEWHDYAFQEYGAIKLIADKKYYSTGETAKVLAILPNEKAHLLITTELMNVSTVSHVHSPGRVQMLNIPIKDGFKPNVYLNVSYVRDGDMYSGERVLNVPATEKILNIEIIPEKNEYKPRETASYTVFVRDSRGHPAPGVELSFGLVDEAIYSLSQDQAGDIRRNFYGRRYNQVRTNFSLSYYFHGYSGTKPIQLAKRSPATHLADIKNEGQYREPTIRKEFKDTAYWEPMLITGSDGKAKVQAQLPDNLTTWRATTRAITADTRVGSSIGKVLAKKDLILRLEAPRFFTEGDTVTLSVTVHNYLNEDKTAKISLEANGVRLLDTAVHSVRIARNGQHRIDWRVQADGVSPVTLLAKALTDTESDAVEIPLNTLPAGLPKSKSVVFSSSDENLDRSFTLEAGSDANAATRSLKLDLSPTIAGTLIGALDYLTSFPYGCTEQTMSSFLPNIVVSRALKEISGAYISQNDLEQKVNRGLERLYDFQASDGGWGWFKGEQSEPFMTSYVTEGLLMALRLDYKVDQNRVNNGLNRLRGFLDSGNIADIDTTAYAAYVVNLAGKASPAFTDKLFANRSKLQANGLGLLALAFKERGDQQRARQVISELERRAQVSDMYAHWPNRSFFYLDVDSTSIAVRALSAIAPQSPVLPKAARWLVNARRQGRYWVSTKDTAQAILALVEFVRTNSELSPEYTLEVYLGGQNILTRSMNSGSLQPVSLSFGADRTAATNLVRIVKRGRGTLYSSSSINYYTTAQATTPITAGLNVTRQFMRLIVDDNDGSPIWKVEPLRGDLKSGDLIVSRVSIRGRKGDYLLIEDPIPAGFEQIARISGLNLDYSQQEWSEWYSFREFRDARTTFFLNSFDGDATLQYAMRVLVPGNFVVAPARAEFMYQPMINGSSHKVGVQVK
jgi:alpha-2-macroglobulin